MARKNTNIYQLLDNQSLAANFTSDPTIVTFMDNCSYQINVTTSNSEGSFAVQASNDYKVDATTGAVINAGTWVALDLGGTPVVAAANDQILINLNQLPFVAIRLAYTSSVAGSGTWSAWLSSKQVGG